MVKKPAAKDAAPADEPKKETVKIDLQPFTDAANASLPEGAAFEVSNVKGSKKRIDLVRGDAITRIETDLVVRDCRYFLAGVAKGRAIE